MLADTEEGSGLILFQKKQKKSVLTLDYLQSIRQTFKVYDK